MDINAVMEQRLRVLMAAFLLENSQLNLSALRTEDACWHGNILDSLPFLDLVEKHIIPVPKAVLDVGTGGGFPLLPLAIAMPQTRFVGLDATAKKIEAIKRIMQTINLPNVDLVADRTESTARKSAYREKYDVVTARAVAPLNTLLEYAIPFVKPHGHVVLWKSMHIDEELAASGGAQRALHCRLVESYTYGLGGDWGVRQLLVFMKTGETSALYPRMVGMAKKEPL